MGMRALVNVMIPRNQNCKSLDELLDLVFQWLKERCPIKVEDQIYPKQHYSGQAA